VTVVPNSVVLEIGPDGAVVLMDNRFQKSVVTVDQVVLASVEPEDELYGPLLAAGMKVVRVGDCRKVRNLRAAVQEGANAGLTIDECVRPNANGVLIS
jgi:hypothetical protein